MHYKVETAVGAIWKEQLKSKISIQYICPWQDFKIFWSTWSLLLSPLDFFVVLWLCCYITEDTWIEDQWDPAHFGVYGWSRIQPKQSKVTQEQE